MEKLWVTGEKGEREQRKKKFTWILDIYKDFCDEQKYFVVEVGNLKFMIEFLNP